MNRSLFYFCATPYGGERHWVRGIMILKPVGFPLPGKASSNFPLEHQRNCILTMCEAKKNESSYRADQVLCHRKIWSGFFRKREGCSMVRKRKIQKIFIYKYFIFKHVCDSINLGVGVDANETP